MEQTTTETLKQAEKPAGPQPSGQDLPQPMVVPPEKKPGAHEPTAPVQAKGTNIPGPQAERLTVAQDKIRTAAYALLDALDGATQSDVDLAHSVINTTFHKARHAAAPAELKSTWDPFQPLTTQP